MRILYVEGTIDHHSEPLANCLRNLLPEGRFAYASVRRLSKECRLIGWSSDESLPWMIPCWRSEKDASNFHDWWQNADIVMCAPRMYGLMEQRARKQQYVFYSSERWFKPPMGKFRFLHPLWAWKALRFRQLARTPSVHYLAIGPYAVSDMRWFVSMPRRLWQWAYFAAPSSSPRAKSSEPGLGVLWAGRMLRWKCVDTLIHAFAETLKKRSNARLTLIGDGPEKHRLIRLASAYLPEESYIFLPPMRPAKVREYMQKNHIYVLPSNGYEGWGVVINEAMTEGCAVVASIETGAAKTLIKDRSNGMLFPCGDVQRLAAILCELSLNETLRLSLAEAGKKTIDEVWSPSTAASRFVAVADALLSHHAPPSYNDGPMQLA